MLGAAVLLYLGFMAVTFSLMSVAQRTDAANDSFELPDAAALAPHPLPHQTCGGLDPGPAHRIFSRRFEVVSAE